MSDELQQFVMTAATKSEEQHEQAAVRQTAQQPRSLQALPAVDVAQTNTPKSEQSRMPAPLQAAVSSQPLVTAATAATGGSTIAAISTQAPPLVNTTGNTVVNNVTSHTLSDSVPNDSNSTNTSMTSTSPQNTITLTAKKSLIETRRAEQNRAAQRAFRQRKERYVKDLEAKVNMMVEWQARMEQLEKENQQLKRRIEELEAERPREDNESITRRTAIKLNYDDTAYTNSTQRHQQSQSASNQHVHEKVGEKDKTSSAVSTPSAVAATTTITGTSVAEKGKVLDDLVSILRTRNRPPISSHPPN